MADFLFTAVDDSGSPSLYMKKSIHQDGELPFDVCSRAEGLPWVEASQQRLDRHIYSTFSVILKEISRDRIG